MSESVKRPMTGNERPKQTHSEKMAELDEQVEKIKGSLDMLMKMKREGNPKQVAYWVGKFSRDAIVFGRACLGEAVIEQKGKLIT
jgi:hypothetical protein